MGGVESINHESDYEINNRIMERRNIQQNKFDIEFRKEKEEKAKKAEKDYLEWMLYGNSNPLHQNEPFDFSITHYLRNCKYRNVSCNIQHSPYLTIPFKQPVNILYKMKGISFIIKNDDNVDTLTENVRIQLYDKHITLIHSSVSINKNCDMVMYGDYTYVYLQYEMTFKKRNDNDVCVNFLFLSHHCLCYNAYVYYDEIVENDL